MFNSQNTQILEYLKQGNSITPLEALSHFNCFRLSGRIHNIKAMGYQIKSELVSEKGKRFSKYSLINNK